jgi:hypothetical protein
MGEAWVDQVALQSIRLERCQRFDSAHYSLRVLEARATFDRERDARLDSLVGRLETEADEAARLIEAMPEGVAWMLSEWAELRADLVRPEGIVWSPGHLETARLLLGLAESSTTVDRLRVLTEVVARSFGNSGQIDAPGGLDAAGLVEWARLEWLTVVDLQIARLEAIQASTDPKILERQRAQAEDLALFDPSQEASLARKYEAATLRAFHKAIQKFHEAEVTAHATMDEVVIPVRETTCDELGSFGQEAEPEPEPAVPPPPRVAIEPSKPEGRIIRTPEERKKRPNPEKLRR